MKDRVSPRVDLTAGKDNHGIIWRLLTTDGDSGSQGGPNSMEGEVKNNGEIVANPFARGGLSRSPPQQTPGADEQIQTVLQQNTRHEDNQEQQQRPPSNSGWNLLQQQPKLVVAKNWAEELHEFIDKKHNVHKDIKELVLKIRKALGSAVKEWNSATQRAEKAERDLAAAKHALESAVLQQQTPRTAPGKSSSKEKEKLELMENTPISTKKRHRTSPGDERPGGSKKKRDGQHKRTAAKQTEQVGGGNKGAQWQVVQNKSKQNRRNADKRQKSIKNSVKKKGEAIVVKTSQDGYLDVLRTMRTAPELKEFGKDVQKIRRTRAGEMIFELKKDSTNSSSSYKELAEKVVGDMVQVRAMAPEVTLECVDLDEITTADDVKTALKEEFELGNVEMSIRLRRGPSGTQVAVIKLPVEAADKALRIGKVNVGWSVCSLSLYQQPEICFRCQGFGHLARNCKGPDRSKLCRRCGEEGHKARECTKPPQCMICENGGRRDHITGGPKCPAFKQAMSGKS